MKLWLVQPDGTAKFTGSGRIPDLDEPSTGSAKIDAYRWAIARYLRPNHSVPGVGAYYVDAFWLQRPQQGQPDLHTLSNHDWFIARRAFFFDLSPWGDEPPVDDPTQPLGADKKRCLLEVLRLLYQNAGGGVVRLGGFPPWPFKYTTHGRAGKHDGVPTEWELGSSRNSMRTRKRMRLAWAPLPTLRSPAITRSRNATRSLIQNRARPTRRDEGFVDEANQVAPRLFCRALRGRLRFPSWLYKAVPAFFRDANAGRVPLGWAFNPQSCGSRAAGAGVQLTGTRRRTNSSSPAIRERVT